MRPFARAAGAVEGDGEGGGAVHGDEGYFVSHRGDAQLLLLIAFEELPPGSVLKHYAVGAAG